MPGAKFVGLAHVQQNRALSAAALRDQVVDILSAKEKHGDSSGWNSLSPVHTNMYAPGALCVCGVWIDAPQYPATLKACHSERSEESLFPHKPGEDPSLTLRMTRKDLRAARYCECYFLCAKAPTLLLRCEGEAVQAGIFAGIAVGSAKDRQVLHPVKGVFVDALNACRDVDICKLRAIRKGPPPDGRRPVREHHLYKRPAAERFVFDGGKGGREDQVGNQHGNKFSAFIETQIICI